MHPPKRILPIIVGAQFLCTSLWFAGNAVMEALIEDFELAETALSYLTSSVQFGFICGTLVFAFLAIADRFSPSRVFFLSAILGATFNLGTIWEANSLLSLVFFRFMTGFFLAGIYPVGMKIAADYFKKGLGKSLGFLVGALVFGTAFPHILSGFFSTENWTQIITITSSLAVLGGGLIFFLVPDGPHRVPGKKLELKAAANIFQSRGFRSAAFGYFGHMWELYAFWAFVPFMLIYFQSIHPSSSFDISLWSFLIIGIGGLACMLGGYIAKKQGTKLTAARALLLSLLCCILCIFMFRLSSPYLFLAFLLFWGAVVVADSPLFSTLVADNANPELKGSALTIVNCIGFAISILSIQLIGFLVNVIPVEYAFIFLAIGPLLGLIALKDS
ncbi:MAG: MFS transporter [Bacteroidia bacterium]|nr:MFS transporter [Bacteroidia bacterium]